MKKMLMAAMLTVGFAGAANACGVVVVDSCCGCTTCCDCYCGCCGC